ncbi:MAG: ATP-binding protein [Candidatus Omnitrophota bacterium]
MTIEKFFDRDAYLEILRKRILGLKESYRQNIAIIGDEWVGKTSIIFKFLNKFQDNYIIPVYLEVRPEAQAAFVKRFIGVLLYNFLINSGMPLQEDLGLLIKESEKYIPRTVEKIKGILSVSSKRKADNAFTELLSLTEALNQETGKFCVVIFDEFLNLENLGFKNLYRDWSKLLIVQKKTMYIIVSSMKFKAKCILSKNLSLLFGNFEVLSVLPFDIRSSEQYLASRLQALNSKKFLLDFLVHFTGGYPLYLEVISDALLKSGPDNLVFVLENLIFDSTGILHQRFSNYIKRFLDTHYSNDYLSILYLISSGRNKIKDIAHILRKTRKDLASRINHLLEIDTLTRSGDFLKLNDRVLAFWLRFVYQEKLCSLTFDAKNQKEKFRKNIEKSIHNFYQASQQSLMERCLEVLGLFGDELIQVERKKIRLNHFREIKSLEFNNRRLKEGLIGRSHDSLWIMAFKRDRLCEDDIADFAKECKKYRQKTQRKIMVTLQDEIDANTKLRALEERIWTWDIHSLNQILDLFSKPWVVT